ncbi:MAG: hypothetical protein AAGI24_07635 [Pseudomonadota bacterium]
MRAPQALNREDPMAQNNHCGREQRNQSVKHRVPMLQRDPLMQNQFMRA